MAPPCGAASVTRLIYDVIATLWLHLCSPTVLQNRLFFKGVILGFFDFLLGLLSLKEHLV